MKIIDGQKLAEELLQKLKNIVSRLAQKPQLEIIQVGKDFASDVYVTKKQEWGESIGMTVNINKFDDISEDKLIELIEGLNNSDVVDGIIVQLPLPDSLNTQKILEFINPNKDVDGLNPISLGYLWSKSNRHFASATPLAVMECLKYLAIYDDGVFNVSELHEEVVEKKLKVFLAGKKVLLINRSAIVGKPLAALLINNDATVTIAHSKSTNLKDLCLTSDIIISGTGKPGFINSEMIPEKAILIDIGINNTANGVGGDINSTGAEEKIAWITPVPGGVGPLTVAMLLKNTIVSSERKQSV